MPVLNVKTFGGEWPSVAPRALPAQAAQRAHNLLASTGEFRPLMADLSVATSSVNNPLTLYRLARKAGGVFNATMTEGWIASAQDVSYVKGQIDDDTTERTFYTFNDGSAPPRALDVTGQDRLLGVPAPATAPGVAVNVVDEFSVDEARAAETTVQQQIADAIKAAMVESLLGNGISLVAPNASTVGWLAHGTGVTGTLPSVASVQANFCVPVVGGNMSFEFTFLKDAAYGGMEIVYSGVTYWAVAIDLYAPIWLPYDAALADRLEELVRPDDAATALFLPAEVTSIVASSLAYWSPASDPLKSAIDAATRATIKLRDVIDSLGAPANYATDKYDAALAAFKGSSYAAAGPGFDRVFYQAAEFSKLEAGGVVPSPSRYWIDGGAATCYANLGTDMSSCVTVDETGFVTFNFGKFADLLREDFLLLINQDVADKQARTDALASVIEYILLPYREFFSKSNLTALGSEPKTDAQRTLAFNNAAANADAALFNLSNLGALLYSQRDTAAKNAYALGPQARVSAAGVSRIVDGRFYFCTQVTSWGEESAPSPVSVMTEPDQNDSVTVTCPVPPTGRHIAAIRIYRSNVGTRGAAFQLAAQLDKATQLYLEQYPDVLAAFNSNPLGMGKQQYVDTHFRKHGTLEQRTSPSALAAAGTAVTDAFWVTATNLQFQDKVLSSDLQEVCPTLAWLEPPATLRGLVGLPNGVMAGFVDNYVAFCHPYTPYAWPVEYQVTTEHPIVGLGVFGQTVFVGTRGAPYFISGSDSASMSSVRVGNQACVSRRSIAALHDGVMFASPDGLCMATPNGVQCVTDGSAGGPALWAAQDWSDDILGTNPEALRGVAYEGLYIFFYNNGTASGCYALGQGKLVALDLVSAAIYVDLVTDTMYVVSGTAIKAAFSAATARTATWKSGVAVLPAQAPLAWAQVESDFEAPVTVRWTADGALRHTMTFSSRSPQRLPPGRYLEHTIEVESAARVTGVTLAGSTDELRSV